MTYYISNKRLIENNLINISIAAYLKKTDHTKCIASIIMKYLQYSLL